ncbi:MAG: DAK2 domain-containing protein [Actinobacteria bacterium]|nr:DAK2 domain-containing protein [Actinomycetota bacterium]
MAEVIKPEKIPEIIRAMLTALKLKQDEIDRLNVYPVPDGDTGTNMVLSMESVFAEVAKADGDLAAIAEAATFGSLMGARGNSGVILSQMIRGFFDAVADRGEISATGLIEGFQRATKVAYQAVKKPVEGTMLTVIKDVAEAVSSLAEGSVTVKDVLEIAVHAADESVKRTPELLPVLKEAGVVDAGGYGLVVMVKGAMAALLGAEVSVGGGESVSITRSIEQALAYTYCTELVIKGTGLDKESFEREIEHLGNSMLVVGTPEILKVHIHTDSPGLVLQAATAVGALSDVQVNNMVEQAAERTRLINASSSSDGVGVVAVATGKGVREIFQSLGVDSFVNGGQSMNPSTSEILEAVDSAASQKVIILPNNKNVILAAQQVDNLTKKDASVIPTKSIAEGLSAMLGFHFEKSLEENVKDMAEAALSVKTGEVSVAVREVNGIKKGDFVGMSAGDIMANGHSLIGTTMALVDKMVENGDQSITILVGDEVSDEQVAELSLLLADRHPELEADVHQGDQPIYHFIIGME